MFFYGRYIYYWQSQISHCVRLWVLLLTMKINTNISISYSPMVLNYKYEGKVRCQSLCPEDGDYNISKILTVQPTTMWCHLHKIKQWVITNHYEISVYHLTWAFRSMEWLMTASHRIADSSSSAAKWSLVAPVLSRRKLYRRPLSGVRDTL